MNSLITIKKTREQIAKGDTTAEKIVAGCLKAIKEKDSVIHSFLEVFEGNALALAKEEDRQIGKGALPKPLSGIPIALKDVILVFGKNITAGSKILAGYKASYDATVVKKLKEAGAIIIGRTNMDEFAMGSSTENSAYGPTKNPLDLSRVPGGSSGGSAAAVAMGGALGALGSDTGGSIRQPASFCGLVGLKPTYGRVSRNGLIAMASSLDQIGPLTKTVADAEIIYDVISGVDPKDSTSRDIPKSGKIPEHFRVGILRYDKSGVSSGVNLAFNDAVKTLRGLECDLEEVELPSLEYALACYYIIMPAEASTNLARFDGVKYGFSANSETILKNYLQTRGRGFGAEARRRIILGTYVLSAGYYDAYYARAANVREAIAQDFKKVFKKYDAILSPTSPTVAFKLGEKSDNPLEMYLSDIFTVSVNIARLPAISFPARLPGENNLPVGLQFIAPWFREDILFALGKKYEHAASGTSLS